MNTRNCPQYCYTRRQDCSLRCGQNIRWNLMNTVMEKHLLDQGGDYQLRLAQVSKEMFRRKQTSISENCYSVNADKALETLTQIRFGQVLVRFRPEIFSNVTICRTHAALNVKEIIAYLGKRSRRPCILHCMHMRSCSPCWYKQRWWNNYHCLQNIRWCLIIRTNRTTTLDKLALHH